jgi:hypothetical protein
MEKKETFPQLNLTLLKNKKTINLLFLSIGVSIIMISILLSDNSCGLSHIGIIFDLQSYEKSLDPEFCEALIEKIDSYNVQCMPQVEILDCG